MRFTGLTGRKNLSIQNRNRAKPLVSFYELTAILNDGTILSFRSLKGKKVLLVNTASDCGFTNQYDALQQLHEKYGNKVYVLAFPSNNFKEQEKGNDDEIAAFCKLNYGVTFPLAKKSPVTGAEKNEVFQWLSDKNKNGWNSQEPTWNFSKYLVNEEGILLNYFDPGISPMSDDILNLINDHQK